jgi:hypothetical protein
MNKTLKVALTVAVVVIAISGLFFPKGKPVVEQTLGAFSGPDIYDDVRFQGKTSTEELTQGGGVLNISTTSSTYTLTQAELANANVIEIEAIAAAGQAALALTLPATSTLTTLLPKVGNLREWIIEDNHTAAATTTTITAGTGIDLIAYTTNDDVIDGGEFSQLTCWRKENSDVGCFTTEILAAD